ncbi:MAG: 4-hydroxythreonine-4-phosphate dehydrogenase PdxA [Bacteroidales bacterium]|nr:4-hydroxythreonine-4-phosphate dehydrogenase PdxA [Bacteroidales bacterium]
MTNGKIVVGITQGDSNGIGYEVIIKALSDPRILEGFIPVVYGSPKLFGFYSKSIPEIEQMDTLTIKSAEEAQAKKVNILDCLPENVFAEPGDPTEAAANAAVTSLERAVKDIKSGKVDVLVTGPINKKSMSLQGFGFPGHTEYLQRQFGAEDVAMLMISSRLKLGVVTGHIPLKEVTAAITEEKILSKLRLIKASLQQDFQIDNPRIGVLSLNPHSGDGGLLGSEEQNIIIPAIHRAAEEGILAFGPYSPDGYFGLSSYEKFDATLAMYHDQGLAPFKALSFEDGVNYTAGLSIVRTSPDHGTAYDMAGRDEADPRSMRAAIFQAIDIFKNRHSWKKLQDGKMIEPEREAPKEKPGRPQIA